MTLVQPKILILHDYFLYKGGGERLVISLAKNLGADVATAFIAKDAFDPREHGIKTIELYKEKPWSRVPGFRYLQVQLSFLFKTKFVRNYDVVIYSGDCLVAVIRALGWRGLWRTSETSPQPSPLRWGGGPITPPPPQGRRQEEDSHHLRNIAYMHSPPRHLYDLYKERLAAYPWWKKIIFVPFVWFNRWRFEWLCRKLDTIVTNSENTRKRIQQYLGLDSVVVYPPCDTLVLKNGSETSPQPSPLRWGGGPITPPPPQGRRQEEDSSPVHPYFFSWARLYDVKRVPMIVEAFIKMPDKQLIVASGGPDLEKIQKMAAGHSNIKILGWINDEQLIEYLGKCLATIYIPMQEDFGMTAVESMQAGKPVIGVAEGGLLEIIEDNKNGLMLESNFTVDDLCAAVQSLTPDRASVMESVCEETAKKFSEKSFIEGMKKVIEGVC
ncbi:MAG: glycosyltransferase [Candidatus Magasanikbacteria bacterium]|nr:glycosyltransferase [Candidatus Magasanikbacteria bacterium]